MPRNNIPPNLIIDINEKAENDTLGYPTYITVGKVGSYVGFRKHVPHNICFLNKARGKIMCSCCGRQLSHMYLASRRWRFCPRCGAEVMGRGPDADHD